MNVLVRLWFIMDKELIEVAYMLEKCLGLKKFIHDDEDTWEWCTSTDNEDGIDYDISRKHDFGKGVYEYPIGLYVKKNKNNFINGGN